MKTSHLRLKLVELNFFASFTTDNQSNFYISITNAYEKGTDYYPLLQAARMIESELKADPQYKTSDKVELKADKKVKAKGAANSISSEQDLNSLEKAWSKTASEMKIMQKTIQDITTCIGH